MAIRYDPAKAAANLRKHGVSFSDAEVVLNDPLALTMDDTHIVGEQRFITVGLGGAGELLLIVWTARGDDHRLISARRPTREERKNYES